MRIEQIIYFQKLAQTGSITATSQQLYLSQQALSTAIKKLEEELQTQLFTRTPKGVLLTPDGEYLVTEFNKITNILEQIHIHFLAQNTADFSLNIGTIPVVNRHILPKSISYFYKNLPSVNLNISVMSPDHILQATSSGDIDLGFISEMSFEQHNAMNLPEDLSFMPLFHLPFSIVMHRDHPLNKYRVLSFEQLAPYPALLLDFGDLEHYLPYQILQHYHIEHIIKVDNEILYNQMLEDGVGYALYTQITSRASLQLDSSLTLHPLKENLFSTIGYIQRNRTDHKSAYIKLFCDHLTD